MPIKTVQDVIDDMQKWVGELPRPDEWKMNEWIEVLASAQHSDLANTRRAVLTEVEQEIMKYRAELEISGESVEASRLAWTIEQYVRDLRAEQGLQ